jgi:hypothetical protein
MTRDCLNTYQSFSLDDHVTLKVGDQIVEVPKGSSYILTKE